MSSSAARVLHFLRSSPWFAVVLAIALTAVVVTEVLVAIVIPQQGNTFWFEFGQGTLIQGDRLEALLAFALVLLAPFFLRFCARLPWRTVGRWAENNVVMIVLASLIFYAALMHYVGQDIAQTPDESCAILQARTFASLHLTSQVQPDLARLTIPQWIQDDFILFSNQTGRYSPTYWPGYSLVMAPFARFGVEWLCNPVLTALTLLLLFHLACRLTGTKEGGVWALLFALSASQIVINSATYFSMPAHLLFNLVFCWLLVSNTKRAAFGAGLVGGFALILHNPAPHFSFAAPWLVWMCFRRRSHLFPLLTGYALIFLPLAVGWSKHLQNFDAGMYVKQAVDSPQTNAFGKFGEVFSRIAYSVRLPSAYLWYSRLAGLCKLIIWAAPGAAGLALMGWLRARTTRRQQESPASPIPFANEYLWLFGASLAFNLVLYLFVRFDQGHGWGFRYMHQTWIGLALLPAFFLVKATAREKKLAALFCLTGMLVILPIRFIQLRTLTDSVLVLSPASPPAMPSITFVEDKGVRSVFIQNDPFLRGTHWNLRSQSPAQNAAVARRYLANARPKQKGEWGEMWVGDRFKRSGSPMN